MKRNHTRWLALALAAALALAGCTPRVEEARDDSPSEAEEMDDSISQEAPGDGAEQGQSTAAPDFSVEHITGHIDLSTAQQLTIARPTEDLTIEAAAYYITGLSDPALPLTLNGETVEDRGQYGSFGVYVDLEWGENVFVFSQGEAVGETVTITRAEVEVGTGILTAISPSYDVAVRSGDSTTLTCTGPAGGAVSVEFQGESYEMEQAGTAEADGVPVTFSLTLQPEEVSGTVELGPLSYILNWQGEESSYRSAGSVFVVGSGDDLLVRAVEGTRSTFQDESTQDDYHTPIQRGAVDRVEQIGANRYLLAMGGWVLKEAVEPLTDVDDCHNVIADAQHTVRDSYELLTLRGSSPAPYSARREDGALHLTFYHTSGLEALELSGSAIFSGTQLVQEDGALTISFLMAGGDVGYAVSYSGNDTSILFRAPATASAGERPLEGITVLVDAGHGGTDDGASGIAAQEGPVEKDITLATAVALQKYLEASGADVIMTRVDDSSVDNSDRLARVQQPDVDLMLSLHCNSIPANSDGTDIAGTEVHYYDEISQGLAQAVLDSICERTGRRNRGILHSYFEVTLASSAPSVLVEMGFMTNPVEYDQLCDPEEIYVVVEAIVEGIIEALR